MAKTGGGKKTPIDLFGPPPATPSRMTDVDTLRIHQNLTCFKKSPRTVKKLFLGSFFGVQNLVVSEGVKKSGFSGTPGFRFFGSVSGEHFFRFFDPPVF